MKFRRTIGLAVVGGLVVLGGTVSPAAAAVLHCGDVITQSVVLENDVGPCPGDGLIIRGSNITVDLGGHRVFQDTNGPLENVGIRLANVTGVTLQNGTVEGFDAGVFINLGGSNTIQRITARNNINDMAEPYVFQPGEGTMTQPDVVSGAATPQEWNASMLCFFGDGITTESSNDNVIRQNQALHNGPYGGITLVGDSNGNQVVQNVVSNNNVRNWTVQHTPSGSQPGPGLCGATLPGAPGMQRGREVQNSGVRIEGPGADHNVIQANIVDNNGLAGVSIHSWVCNPMPGEPRPGFPNSNNLITGNAVTRTGLETAVANPAQPGTEGDPYADGISVLASGPIGRVTCTSNDNTIVRNTSTNNVRHGISVMTTAMNETVNENVVTGNGADGILVAEEAVNNTLIANRGFQNHQYDAEDDNPNCDNNNWSANQFGTVYQGCEANGGSGSVGGPLSVFAQESGGGGGGSYASARPADR